MSNRAEHQKLNQKTAELSFGWAFGVQLDSLEKTLITLAAITFTYTFPAVDETPLRWNTQASSPNACERDETHQDETPSKWEKIKLQVNPD